MKVAIAAGFSSWFWRGDRAAFETLFYGEFTYRDLSLVRHVKFDELTLVLLAVAGALLFISLNASSDAARSQGETARDSLPKPREPEFLDVEVLPPEHRSRPESLDAKSLPSVKAEPPHDARRLHD